MRADMRLVDAGRLAVPCGSVFLFFKQLRIDKSLGESSLGGLQLAWQGWALNKHVLKHGKSKS